MNIENLVFMANRIGEFFSAYADRSEGEREIANHLRRFWEPRMRRALLAHLDNTGGEGLDEIVKSAVQHHSAALMPTDRATS
jgi:formate dehydrogenase subunit delta